MQLDLMTHVYTKHADESSDTYDYTALILFCS